MTADQLPPDSRTPIGVWLELHFDAQPIEGTLSLPGGPPSPFVGWLGLTGALEALRAEREPCEGESAR